MMFLICMLIKSVNKGKRTIGGKKQGQNNGDIPDGCGIRDNGFLNVGNDITLYFSRENIVNQYLKNIELQFVILRHQRQNGKQKENKGKQGKYEVPGNGCCSASDLVFKDALYINFEH